MHILLADETNVQPSRDVKFLIYGGLLFPVDNLNTLDTEIERIRQTAGYQPGDELKFDTRARPEYVSIEDATAAKRQIIDLCIETGCQFIVHIILHEIIRNQDLDQQIQWAADYVIGRYNRYLSEVNDTGICVIDHLPCKSEFAYLSDKLQFGLHIGTRTVRLDRIKLFASTCVGASHANSAMDIVLGSFWYCINAPRSREAAAAMLPKIVRMMWHKRVGDTLYFRDRGLILRPPVQQIHSDEYRAEYKGLVDHLYGLLAQEQQT